MSKKAISKTTAVISLFMCVLLVFNSGAVAVGNEVQTLAAESIEISRQCGILKGETLQLEADIEPNYASVKWYSSNPDVVSCTSTGEIKGEKSGGYADIICESKYGSVRDSIRVYCVKQIYPAERCNIKDFAAFIYSQPNSISMMSFHININFLSFVFRQLSYIFSFINTSPNVISPITSGDFEVHGSYGSYAYIRYNGVSSDDGFIKHDRLDKEIDAFLSLSASDINVWADGVAYGSKKLTAKYSGDVEWDVDDDSLIDFNEETGQITGKAPGKTTITAKADGMTATCTVHSIYPWPQSWTGKVNKETYIYKAKGNDYSSWIPLHSGEEFVVLGDCGTDGGWAYGYYEVGENKHWGYIPVADVSTKGTISQYNNMTTTLNEKKVPLVWPMYDESIKNISSPYGPRNITSSGTIHHRGYDITTGTRGEIAGEYVVASFSGTVTKIYTNTSDCGYCISISTDAVDPVTQKNISIIYMHLLEIPKYKNGINISLGDYIPVGTIIGKVGKSNGNTDPNMGYHLHFEANSQNAAVGDSGRSDFTYTLNPMHFFMEKEVTFSNTNSYNKYGGYWYDLNGGYQNEEIFKSYFNF